MGEKFYVDSFNKPKNAENILTMIENKINLIPVENRTIFRSKVSTALHNYLNSNFEVIENSSINDTGKN